LRAVVVDPDSRVRVDNRPDPALPGADGAVIQVTDSAICGSDLHFLDGHFPVIEPVAVGHEAVGVIAELGTDVRGFAVGDRVLVSSVAGCGHCAGCRTTDPVRCVRGPQIFGSGVLGGAQADLLAVPAAEFQLLRVPDEVDTEAALLLTDNLATGWAAAIRADIPVGGTVAVIGAGAVGQCALRSALLLGAAVVHVIDPVQGRRDSAARAGGLALTAPGAAAVLDATDGLGADAVIDAVGTDASIDDALACVRVGGTVSVVGVHDLAPYPLPALACLLRSLTIRLTTAPVQQTWPALLPLLRTGRLDVRGIFTAAMPLTDAAAAYAAAMSRTDGQVKIRLTA
jgi:alcohol dehydrogenase